MFDPRQLVQTLQTIPHTNQTPPASSDIYAINVLTSQPIISAPDADVIIPLELQRYTFNPANHSYRPLLDRKAIFQLRVESFAHKDDACRTLPYLITGFPYCITPQFYRAAYPDPILKRFSAISRLVFRYSAERNIGFLAHIGFDLVPIDDDDSLIPLWLTAVNQDPLNGNLPQP